VYIILLPLGFGVRSMPCHLTTPLALSLDFCVVKIALLFVFSIFPNLLSSPLLHFFLSIYPWSTWFPWVRSMILFLDCKSVIIITLRYIFCSNQYLYGVGGVQLGWSHIYSLSPRPSLVFPFHYYYKWSPKTKDKLSFLLPTPGHL
jgi:hypothetical protein